MAGLLSVRVSKQERAELRRKWQEANFPSLSAWVRVKLGFDPDGGFDPVGPEYEEMDQARILPVLADLKDRNDQVIVLLRAIARSVGASTASVDKPREYPRTKPVEPPGEDGIMDVPTDRELATQLMPTGFERTV